MSKHTCTEENAPKFLKWIRERGGVAVWDSLDPCRDSTVSTPAQTKDGKPTPKPYYWVGGNPIRVYTKTSDIEVIKYKEVKRFRVGVRAARGGMMLKVTDGGTRRIHREVEKAGEGATYQFDYDTQEAVIMAPDSTIPLEEWKPCL